MKYGMEEEKRLTLKQAKYYVNKLENRKTYK